MSNSKPELPQQFYVDNEKLSEKYAGVKFKTVMNCSSPLIDKRLDELKLWCKIFHEKKFAPHYQGGSFGNLSFRLKSDDNEFIITGTSIGLKNKLTNDCFVKVKTCNINKNIVFIEGVRNPSSESMLHYAIYKQRKDVNAIFHGHCKELLASVDKLKIPETEKEEAYGTIGLANSVLKISEKNNFFIIKNHGFLSLGGDMKEAGELSIAMLNKCFGTQLS